MYDTETGRMLAVDNYVLDAHNSQDYNRYSYARNNPLKYSDPSGESIVPVIMALAGAYLGGASANGTLNPTKWDYNSPTTWVGIGTGALMGAGAGALGASGQLNMIARPTVAGVTVGQASISPSNSSYSLEVSSGNSSAHITSWDKKSFTKSKASLEKASYLGGWGEILSSPATQKSFLEHVGRYWAISRSFKGNTLVNHGYSIYDAYREFITNLGVNSNIAAGLGGYDVNVGVMYSRREGLQGYFELGYSVGAMVNPISINAGRYKSQRTNGRLYYNDVRGYGTSNNYSIWFAGYTDGGSVSRQVMQYPPPNFSSSPYSYNGFSISDPYSKTVIPFGLSRSYTHTWISRF
jgi:hypothetical protein